jgi:hypothetical protein
VTKPDLPEPIRRFILEHLPSVERLEILLLLFDRPAQPWSLDELERHIRSTRESVAQNVAALVAAQLATADGQRFRLNAAAPSMAETVPQLAALYRLRRVAIIEAIYSERQGTFRSFSEAFKLGKPHDR